MYKSQHAHSDPESRKPGRVIELHRYLWKSPVYVSIEMSWQEPASSLSDTVYLVILSYRSSVQLHQCMIISPLINMMQITGFSFTCTTNPKVIFCSS